jgi:S-layer homology domain
MPEQAKFRINSFMPNRVTVRLINNSRRFFVRKQILIAFGVLSLTGAAAFGLVQSNFTDVPAGHWAQEAVDYASKAGLVQGYPDQTFKGNKTLTRYEAAMIFYRLQKSGAMGNMNAEGQAAMTAGMGDVQAELEDIKAKLDEADAAAQDQAARLDALEAAPAGGEAAPANADLEARLKALEEKAAAPAEAAAPDTGDLEDRLAALEEKADAPAEASDTTALEDRLKALEEKAGAPAEGGVSADDVKALEDRIAELEAKPEPEATTPAAGADAAKVTALEEKLAALEKKVAETPAPVAGGADAAKVAALEDRVGKLEGQVTALSTEVGSLKAAKPVTPEPTVTSTPTPEPVVTTPDVVVPETPAPRRTNLYVGVGANFPIVATGVPAGFTANSGVGISAVVGLKRALGPIGLRVAADYNLASKTLAVEPNLMFELNPDAFFDPYIGLGGGGVFGIPNSLYVGGAAGVGLNFTQNFGLFVEANPRYTFGAPTNQFGVNLRAGLRFAF